MKVTFLYGRSGSGKTYTITEELRRSVEVGARAFLLVPEQQSHSVERRILSLLPPRAQLSVEALSFSRLANRVFRRYGGLSYHYATGGIQALLMWRRLCELSPLLEEYGEQAEKNPALTDIMLSAVAELKGCGISPTRLERAADQLPANSSLRPRLRDISLIYAAYQNELLNKYDDASDDLSRLDEVLREHDFFRGSHVYIDYFTSFTAQEMNIIRSLFCQAEEVTIALCCDGRGDRSLHLATVAETASQLWRLATDCGCEIREVHLRGNRRARSPELAALEADLWRLERSKTETAIPPEARGAVRLLHCADPYEEAEAAAALIMREVQQGARFRDFVIICRDSSQYEGILDAALEKCRIPAFYAEKTDLSSFPLIKLILTALRIIQYNWRQHDVITHLKTGLCPFSPEDIDLFEGYVATWRLHGKDFLRDTWNMNPDGYVSDERISPRSVNILETANRIRQALVSPIQRLQQALEESENVPAMCRALYQYLEEIDVRAQIRESASRELARGESGRGRAEESLRLYATVLDVLDQMAGAMPEEELSTEEFYTALKLMLDHTQIASIPDTVDQVLIGSASMLRTDEPPYAILLGLSEGVFPRTVQDDGIFSDSDKKTLEQLGLKLSLGTDLRASDELYFVYRAMTAPAERLILICSDADCDGKLRQPSLPFTRTAKLLPYLRQEDYSALPVQERLWCRESALEALPDIADPALHGELCAAVQKDPIYAERLQSLAIPVSDPDCTVSPEVARMIFPRHLSMTQSKMEHYVLCHFGYYCSYVLNLHEEQVARFRTQDIGSLIHAVLETFFQRAVGYGTRSCADFAEALTDGECEIMVDRILADYLLEISPDGQLPSNRIQHLFARLRRLALLLIDNLREEFRHSSFIPTFFELRISENNKHSDMPAPLEIRLENGETVSMHGIVDRVDVFAKDGNVYLRVVDYKTGSKEFSLENARQGLNIQLLLYLFSLLKNSPEAFQKRLGMGALGQLLPAGALYLTANVPPMTIQEDLPPEKIRELAQGRLMRSGLLLNDIDILRAMNDELTPAFLGKVKQSKAKKSEEVTVTGKNLFDLEGFRAIGEELEAAIRHVATSMKEGHAQAKPHIDKDNHACTYCGMRAICRSAVPGRNR